MGLSSSGEVKGVPPSQPQEVEKTSTGWILQPKNGGNKNQEGWVPQQLKEEEEQATVTTWGFPAVGKRQGAPVPAASSLHAPERVPSRGQRKASSTWYALHIPVRSKAGAGGWLCASEEALRKQYPAIAMATGWLRQERAGPIRQGAEQPSDLTGPGAQGPEPSPAAGRGCDPNSQPRRRFPSPEGISAEVSQR